MVRTQIQLTEEQARKVKRIASQRGVPMAEVIRNAIEDAIRSDTQSEDRRTRALSIVNDGVRCEELRRP